MAVDSHPLRQILKAIGPESCPDVCNFHCHTLCSDGSLDPIELIEQASRRGLSHLAVTDHHSSHAHAPMRAWLDDQRSAGSSVPTLWSGMVPLSEFERGPRPAGSRGAAPGPTWAQSIRSRRNYSLI